MGPKADGTIPEVQRERLLDMGFWLKVNGEAMYGTTYRTRAEEKGGPDDVRYTVKDGVLYATALKWPGEQLTLGADVPAGPGTRITLLGSDGGPLPWQRDEQGRVVVITPAETGRYAYSFKIEQPGMSALPRFGTYLTEHVQAGETFTGKVTVTNPGSTTLRAASLALTVPEGWTVTPATNRIGHLAAGASAEVPVTVTVPAGAEPAALAIQATLKSGRLRVPYSIPVSVVLPNLAEGKPATQQPITADGLEAARTTPGVTAVHVQEQAGRPSTIKLPAGTTGRHVRIQLSPDTNPPALAEVRVRGH
ncbi:NEW3 domain-containing protein [Streptosporangium roseum]|uniref:NEW3 domain-containing protein n=1 Tax=Streptosporangium roseum TaxID=2001 RepID=UPI003321542F